MRQVSIQCGRITVEQVPATFAESGHVLDEVACSVIDTGSEISSFKKAGGSRRTMASSVAGGFSFETSKPGQPQEILRGQSDID